MKQATADVPLRVSAVLTFSEALVIAILDAAINGACAGWASVRGDCGGVVNAPSATVVPRRAPELLATITSGDVVRGMQAILSGEFPAPHAMQRQVIRMAANDSVMEVDSGVANAIMRAGFACIGRMTCY